MSTSATVTTVTQYYNNVLQRDPTTSELNSFVSMIDSGALTSTQVLATLVNSSEAQTYAAQVIRFYQAAFGRVPDTTGIDGWVDQLRAGTTTTTDLALGFINSTEWSNRYGGTEVNTATITGLYVNVLGRTPSGAEIDAWKATGQSLDQVFIGFANSAEFKANADTAVNTLLTNAGNTATADIATIYNGTDALPVNEANGETYTLTENVDTVTGTANNDTINATEKTFTALDTIDGGNGTDTLNIADASTSAFVVNTSATVSNVEKLVVTNAALGVTADVQKWSGLESVTVAQQAAAAVDIDTKGNATSVSVNGGTTVNVTDNATTDTLASVSLDGNTGAATIGGTGSAAERTSITSLSLANTAQSATIHSAAATRDLALTLNNVTGGTINDDEATGLNISTTGAASSGVTIDAAKVKAVTVNADEKLTVASATITAVESLTVTGDSLVTLQALGTPAASLATIDASGSTGGIDISALELTTTQFTGGAGADAVQLGASTKSTSMGAGDDSVTLSGSALGTGGSVDAGQGTDTLKMTAANAETASGGTTFEGTISNFEKLSVGQVATGVTNTVNLANLDDISYVVSEGTGAAITAVAQVTDVTITGTVDNAADTVSIVVGGATFTTTTDVSAGTGAIASALATLINGNAAYTASATGAVITITAAVAGTPFTVGTTSATSGGGAADTVSGAANTTTGNVAAVAAGALNLTNMANAGTVELTAAGTGATVTMTDATGSSDSINLVLKNASATDFGTVSVADVETVAITTDDTTDPSNGDLFTLSLTDAAAKTITVSGDAGLALTHGGTAVTSFDASGVTKGSVTWTTGNLAGDAVLKGGAGDDTIDASAAATKTVNIEGGAGNDTLTGSASKANTLAGGEGNDVLTGGSAADTITGGDGTDTIDGKGGLDTLTGGDGNDTFVTSVVATNGNSYATITDATAGDIVKSSTGNGTEVFTSTAITLASTAAFQDYLDAATAGAGNVNSQIAWFQFGGNTYIVEDNSAGSTFQNGADSVVALTGAIDLSGATFAAPGDWTLTIA